MTEPELVSPGAMIQRRLERRRAVGGDHTTRRPEVHLVRRRRHRHLPHRATRRRHPPSSGCSSRNRGISGARAISAQAWLDSGERDDDQGRRREGGKVAAEHALRHRARGTGSRPPFGWSRLGGGACNTAQGDLRHSNGGSAAHRSGGLDSGPGNTLGQMRRAAGATQRGGVSRWTRAAVPQPPP